MTKIPVSHSYSILGEAPAYVRDPIVFLEQHHQTLGDIFKFRVAHRSLTVLRHPDHIRQVLQEFHNHYKKNLAYRKLGLLLGQGLFTSEGDFWLRQRRLAAPAFHREKLQGYFQYINEQSIALMENWKGKKEIVLNKSLTEFTLKVISKTLLSIDLAKDTNSTIEKELPGTLQFLLGRVLRPVNVPMLFPLPSHLNFRRSVKSLTTLIRKLIAERSNGAFQDDLLSMLMQAADDEGMGMSETQLIDEVLTFYLAGHETTAVALTWTVWLLQKHPLVYQKLREEVLTLGSIDSMHLQMALPYTKAVIQESMRLYSPVWVLGREAIVDHELSGGYRIRKGDSVIFCPFLVHRHTDFWKDAETFSPERFIENSEPSKFSYFPFGGGPRLCIGSNFAMMEMMVFLVHLGRNFSAIKSENSSFPGYEYSLTLRPRQEIKIDLTP